MSDGNGTYKLTLINSNEVMYDVWNNSDCSGDPLEALTANLGQCTSLGNISLSLNITTGPLIYYTVFDNSSVCQGENVKLFLLFFIIFFYYFFIFFYLFLILFFYFLIQTKNLDYHYLWGWRLQCKNFFFLIIFFFFFIFIFILFYFLGIFAKQFSNDHQWNPSCFEILFEF